MSRILFNFILIYFSIIPNHAKRIFEENVDDIFGSLLGDVYKFRSNVTIPPPYGPLNRPLGRRKSDGGSDTDSEFNRLGSPTTTAAREHVATPPMLHTPISDAFLKQIKVRILTREIQSITQEGSPMAVLQSEDDQFTVVTRKFNSLKKINISRRDYRRDNYPMGNYLGDNDLYGAWENITAQIRLKRRMASIMEHFIYATRYRLMYSQKLKVKYKHDPKYKLGFLFSLLKTTKQKQRILMSALRKEYLNWYSLYVHLKVYERIIRFHVDIKDIIKYIKQIEYERKKKEFPDYYDFITSPRPPYWRRKGGDENFTNMTTPTY